MQNSTSIGPPTWTTHRTDHFTCNTGRPYGLIQLANHNILLDILIFVNAKMCYEKNLGGIDYIVSKSSGSFPTDVIV